MENNIVYKNSLTLNRKTAFSMNINHKTLYCSKHNEWQKTIHALTLRREYAAHLGRNVQFSLESIQKCVRADYSLVSESALLAHSIRTVFKKKCKLKLSIAIATNVSRAG